jgi:hypothetical protein
VPSQVAGVCEIYALCDPESGDIRYIGKANNAAKRLAGHIRESKRRDTPVYRWIRKLGGKSLVPAMVVLETVPSDDWKSAEKRLIASHRLSGTRLLNVAEGGDEPFCPHEVRVRNGHATWGKMQTANPPNVTRLYRWLGHQVSYFKRRIKVHGDGHRMLGRTELAIASLGRTVAICKEIGNIDQLDAYLPTRFKFL